MDASAPAFSTSALARSKVAALRLDDAVAALAPDAFPKHVTQTLYVTPDGRPGYVPDCASAVTAQRFEQQTFVDAWNALPDVSVPSLDEAKALVEEAGATGQTVRLGMSSELGAINVTAGEFQRALESIGMKAELVSVSAASYISFFIDPAAREGVDGFFTVNYPDYADPFALYSTMIGPDGSQAFNGYADPAAIDLVDQIRTATDPATQAECVERGSGLGVCVGNEHR